MALTTRKLFKQFAEIALTDTDAKIDRLIIETSAAIEGYLNRSLSVATYRKWFDGSGTNQFLLPEWPIQSVYAVTSRCESAMVLSCTSEFATVSVDETNLTLFSIVSGTETETPLSLATYTNMTTLANAVNLLSGWTATISNGYATKSTKLIRPMAGDPCSAGTQCTIEIAGDPDPVKINILSDRMIFRQAGVTTTTTASNGWSNSSNLMFPLTEAAQFPLIFPYGRSNVFIWWKAGYTMPSDDSAHEVASAGTLPSELILGANICCKAAFDASTQDLGVASQSMGDNSYNLDTRSAISKAIQDNAELFTNYRRFL